MDYRDRAFRREIARRYVEKIKLKLTCSLCGEYDIKLEFHNEDHVLHPNSRVGALVTQGVSIERIDREIKRCLPVCRRCHMEMDGRLDKLKTSHDEFLRKGGRTTRIIVCKWGHQLLGNNVGINTDGHRYCRQCSREGNMRRYYRNKEKRSK